MNANGSHTHFKLQNINTTLAVLYSSNDPHTPQIAIDTLFSSVPSSVIKHFENIPQLNHIDFLFARTAPQLVYERIVAIESSISWTNCRYWRMIKIVLKPIQAFLFLGFLRSNSGQYARSALTVNHDANDFCQSHAFTPRTRCVFFRTCFTLKTRIPNTFEE